MTKDNNKVTIKFKEKEYEIEKTKDEQKVKPKGGKTTDKAITVKDYEEGGFFTSHKFKCSEDGTNFEVVNVKWGTKKHVAIWSIVVIVVMALVFVGWYFLYGKPVEKEEKES